MGNLFSISSRAKGSIGSGGVVTIQKLYSYDLVAIPSFSSANLDHNTISKEFQRQELLRIRREKIENLNKISGES